MREQLRPLARGVAEQVSLRLLAAGELIDADPETALAHATAARRLASRIPAVREATGLAAYHAGQWQTAIAELRTYHRISGRLSHLGVLADCERALGRPERAIDIFRTADHSQLSEAEAVELLIVAAGARADLGQREAAVAMLQVPQLAGPVSSAFAPQASPEGPWAARLRYAYADALLGLGRTAEAREWFARAAELDPEATTDAAERLLELDGVVLDDHEDEIGDEDGDEDGGLAAEEGHPTAQDRGYSVDDGANADPQVDGVRPAGEPTTPDVEGAVAYDDDLADLDQDEDVDDLDEDDEDEEEDDFDDEDDEDEDDAEDDEDEDEDEDEDDEDEDEEDEDEEDEDEDDDDDDDLDDDDLDDDEDDLDDDEDDFEEADDEDDLDDDEDDFEEADDEDDLDDDEDDLEEAEDEDEDEDEDDLDDDLADDDEDEDAGGQGSR